MKKAIETLLRAYPLAQEWFAESHQNSPPRRQAAALMAMYDRKGSAFELADVAKCVGATYGTVRVWRADREFSEAMFEEAQSFAGYLISFVYDGTGALATHVQEILRTIAVMSRATAAAMFDGILMKDRDDDLDHPDDWKVMPAIAAQCARRAFANMPSEDILTRALTDVLSRTGDDRDETWRAYRAAWNRGAFDAETLRTSQLRARIQELERENAALRAAMARKAV